MISFHVNHPRHCHSSFKTTQNKIPCKKLRNRQQRIQELSSSSAAATSLLQGRAKLSNEITKSLCFRKPKVSLSLSYYLRSRIASSSEGAIFGPRPTSDSDSLPKLCPIGLDQTSKVKGTNLDKFLNIFQLKFVFYVSTSFAIFILEIKT